MYIPLIECNDNNYVLQENSYDDIWYVGVISNSTAKSKIFGCRKPCRAASGGHQVDSAGDGGRQYD